MLDSRPLPVISAETPEGRRVPDLFRQEGGLPALAVWLEEGRCVRVAPQMAGQKLQVIAPVVQQDLDLVPAGQPSGQGGMPQALPGPHQEQEPDRQGVQGGAALRQLVQNGLGGAAGAGGGLPVPGGRPVNFPPEFSGREPSVD